MSIYSQPSWLDRLLGACCKLLVVVGALYLAVQLLESVWIALIVIGVSLVAVTGLIAVVRRRRQGW